MRRVLVTGLGVVSTIGVGMKAFAASLLEGIGGIRRITKFDPSSLPSQIAGEVRDFDPKTFMPMRDVVRTDTFIHYAVAAAVEAFEDARLAGSLDGQRTGVSIGTAIGGIGLMETSGSVLRADGPKAVSPYAMPGYLANMAAGWVSIRIGAKGPISAPGTACAAGSQAIGEALRMVQRGEADVMIAGGAEAPIVPFIVAGFSALRALSTRNDDPAHASRPFDKDRDGFVLAEGAGVLVLEEAERAHSRGARVYAELAGFGLTADANHPTAPSPDGPARAMTLAIQDAGLTPRDVGYINAHGTSTPMNDANETKAIHSAFGEHARRVAVSSTKSMTGHTLGAAGAIEAVATVISLDRGVLPPTINHIAADPQCDLDYVPCTARREEVQAALSNSFAFGGVNVSLLFRKAKL